MRAKINIFVLFAVWFYFTNGIPSQWFSAKSAWNAPLPDNAPLSNMSAAYVKGVVNQVNKYKSWINWVQYSVPVYTVPANQPTVIVELIDASEPECVAELRKAFETVPLPPDVVPAAGTDKHLVVWQPDTDTMWEFWDMEAIDNITKPTKWKVRWGGKMNNVKTNPGFYLPPCILWGGTATSLPLVGGLVMISELKTGVLEHALPLALPETKQGLVVSPAERGDGWSNSPDAIPEGTRYRFPASLDIPSLKLHPFAEIMAKSLQKYGGLVRDTAGAVVFAYCEPPPATGPDPYAGPDGFFKGSTPDKILENFPWEQLQVVDPSWEPWK